MTQYRVEWRSITSNITGHGDWDESKEFIKSWVDFGNKEWSNVYIHWIGEKM